MSSYSLGSILESNLTSGLPTRTLSWTNYDGTCIQPCNEHYLPENTALPLVIPWLDKYELNGDQAVAAPVSERLVADMSLHDEMLAFVEYMTPTYQEIRAREDLVTRFRNLLVSFDVDASPVEPYGSYVTGLFLATSDIDVFIAPHINWNQRDALNCVQRHLLRMPPPRFHQKIRDVLKASIPLLTITDAKTGLDIDLTAEPSHSVASTRAVVDWMERDSDRGDGVIIKMLVIVVKTFLAIRRCGTTYTGGVNSYLVVWLVVAWVKLELPKLSNTSGPHDNYGDIIIAFFKFYGESFDYTKTKILIAPEPRYVAKTGNQSQPFLLSLIDPADSMIDLGSRAYAIKHVAATFTNAYEELQRLESRRLRGRHVGRQGILGAVLGGDFAKTVKGRNKLVK